VTTASARQFKTSLWRTLWALAGAPATTVELGDRTGMKSDQLYTTLRRLERTGIVRADQSRQRDVIRWSLTEAGKDVIRDFSRASIDAWKRIDEHGH